MPNRTLKAVRLALRMSQSEFAAAVRRSGATLGEPNDCSKRLVQKWESGEHRDCRSNYQRALEQVTRKRFDELGFPRFADSPVVESGVVDRPVSVVLSASPGGSALGSADRLRLALERPGQVDAASVQVARADIERLFALEQYRSASSIGGVD